MTYNIENIISDPDSFFSDLQQENREYRSSLQYASLLQQGILPKTRHFNRHFEDYFVLYQPQHIVSGDFYWLAENESLIYVAVGDCTGHGVPGAMLSVLAYSLLDYAILNKGLKKTNKILKELDKKFIESFSSSTNDHSFNNDWIDISLCCIDKKKQVIYFSGANRKALLVGESTTALLNGNRYPIGGWQIEKKREFVSTSIKYQTGDTLYIGSDGFQDQLGGPNGKKYKSQHLHHLIQSNCRKSMKDQKLIYEQELDLWKGNNQQTDDICLIGLRLA